MKLHRDCLEVIKGFILTFYFDLKLLIISGDQRMYSLLNTATRKSSVLAKAVLPPRKFSNHPGSQQQDDGPGPSHGRSRNRSRSPARKRRDASPGNYRSARKGKKSSYTGKGGSGKAARDSSSKK